MRRKHLKSNRGIFIRSLCSSISIRLKQTRVNLLIIYRAKIHPPNRQIRWHSQSSCVQNSHYRFSVAGIPVTTSTGSPTMFLQILSFLGPRLHKRTCRPQGSSRAPTLVLWVTPQISSLTTGKAATACWQVVKIVKSIVLQNWNLAVYNTEYCVFCTFYSVVIIFTIVVVVIVIMTVITAE